MRPSSTASRSACVCAGSDEFDSPCETGAALALSLPLSGSSAGLFRVSLSGVTSHSPSEAFMIGGPAGSLTQRTVAATRSVSRSVGAKYRTSLVIPGAMPWIACMSMSHSPLPESSEKSPSAGVRMTSTGRRGRWLWSSKACRSLMTASVAPLPRMATGTPAPVISAGCW